MVANKDLEVVSVSGGEIQGTLEDGVWAYFGIPFAAPPVGDLRWRVPHPVQPWSGIRGANKFMLPCPQPKSVFMNVGETSEDCLYLNIWSPAKNQHDKLPVIVNIYGGAFAIGSGSLKWYHGMNIAKESVILVTFNYRLGPLGFLVHPLLNKESQHGVSGNYGMLDQIEALIWVQKNIKTFGGDPKNVTILGQSAGASSVINLLISPLTAGLFHRAVIQSSLFTETFPDSRDDTVEKAEKSGQQLAEKLGCNKDKNMLAAMRRKSADEIVASAFSDYNPNSGRKYRPVIDGWAIPASPWSLYKTGKIKKIPIIVGATSDEGSLFILGDPQATYSKMSAEDYYKYLKELYPIHGAEIASLFPVTDGVPQALNRFATFMLFTAGALHVADSATRNNSAVYMYRFTRTPESLLKQFGAFHAIDVPYFFGNKGGGIIDVPDDKVDQSLSKRMRKYFTNFARTGDPNGAELPKWPVYTVDNVEYVEFGDEIVAKEGLYKDSRELIDRVAQNK